MKAGISTACMYPRQLEEAFYDLAVNGVSCIEIFANTPSELNELFLRELKETADRFEVTIPSFHPFTSGYESSMLFSKYDRRTRDAIEFYKQYFRAMKLLGSEYFVLHGFKSKYVISDSEYFERFHMIAEAGRECGITVLQENVNACKSANLKFLKSMCSQLGDEAQFVLDTKQAIRAGENPFDFLHVLGSRIKHVHISDSGEMGDCLLIGRGRFDYKKFISELYENKYNGAVMLELYRNNFSSITDLINSYNIIETTIKKAGK